VRPPTRTTDPGHAGRRRGPLLLAVVTALVGVCAACAGIIGLDSGKDEGPDGGDSGLEDANTNDVNPGDASPVDGPSGVDTSCGEDEKFCGACVSDNDPFYGCVPDACSCPGLPYVSNPACSAGQCGIGTCQSGYAHCGGSSSLGCNVNITNDPKNCGGCDAGCPDGGFCSGGACVASCPDGSTDCSGGCYDLGADPQHCGSCKIACATEANSTPTCVDGGCGYQCSTGFLDCDEAGANGCECDTHPGNVCMNAKCCLPAFQPCCANAECCSGACAIVLGCPGSCLP
jgi:hypothetical protein